MTLPLLLLGLYLGLLIVAIALASWAGHMIPAPDEARRVTDAAERAGLSHLGAAAKVALGASLLFSCLAGAFAIWKGFPTGWFAITPLVSPLLVGAALYYSGRKLLRAAGQLLGAGSSDERIVLTNRSVVGAVLCCEATIGLLLLSIYSLAAREVGPSAARLIVLLSGSSIALSAIVFARAAASAHFSVVEGTAGTAEEPHAGSLAALVSNTFHMPILRLITLVLLSTLGSCALLTLSHPDEGDASAALWLYPHLLRVLGLFGLLFAGMVARTSEDESGAEAWVRGAIVYLVLMIAGAWSLSSELPVGWALSVPSGLTFLYVALGLSVWFGGSQVERNQEATWGSQALDRLSPTLVFWGLVIVLLLATALTTGKQALPPNALVSLLLSGTLAVVPMAAVWVLARDLSATSSPTSRLAFVGKFYREPTAGSPSKRFLTVLPVLGFVVALCALSGVWSGAPAVSRIQLLLLGLGAGLACLVLGALVGLVEQACKKTISAIAALVSGKPEADAAPLDFESAVNLCRDSISSSGVRWLLLASSPIVLALGALTFVPLPLFRALIMGLALGALVLGVAGELLLNIHPRSARRTLANLSLATGLAQALWLLAIGTTIS